MNRLLEPYTYTKSPTSAFFPSFHAAGEYVVFHYDGIVRTQHGREHTKTWIYNWPSRRNHGIVGLLAREGLFT